MKNLLKSIIILALLVVLSSSSQSFAQGTNPASVYKAAVDAVNAHNVDAVTALFAPDAVVELAGDPQGIFNGQQAIQGWFKSLFDQNIHIDAGKPQVTGSVLISVDKVSLAPWQQQGVGPLDNIAQVVIQGDKIKSLVLSLTPEAGAKLTAAMTKAPAGTDPESLIRTGDALLNAHNVDAASALFTDDAIVTVVPPMPDSTGVFSGQKAIQGWLKTLADQNSTIEPAIIIPTGPSTAISFDRISNDPWRKLGIDSLDNIGQFVFKADKVQSLTVSLTPESGAKLTAAMAKK